MGTRRSTLVLALSVGLTFPLACNAVLGIDEYGPDEHTAADAPPDLEPMPDVAGADADRDANEASSEDVHGDVVAPCDARGDPATSPCTIADAHGIFVAGIFGSDANPGTMAFPVATLAKAKTLAFAAGKRVFACATTFDEALMLDATTDGVSFYGGLDCSSWSDNGALTNVTGGAVAASTPLRITGLAVGTTIEGFAFTATPTNAMTPTSIAGLVVSSSNVILRRVTLTAAAGTAATPSSSTPAQGAGGQKGGDSVPFGGGTPGLGGTTICPDGASAGGKGGSNSTSGAPGTPALGGGQGGAVGIRGQASCGNGAAGANGAPGSAGAGATSAGTVTTLGWVLGPGGTPGGDGKVAQGGGGGGGPNVSTPGSVGGGGGAGGCGGGGGGGGGTGGSSLGLVSVLSMVTLDTCTITAGNGGNGGAGVAGAPGGAGGTGGDGSCSGGTGGTGGAGGGGGGGAGGDSVAIAYGGTMPTTILPTLSYGTPGTHGAGGAGASSNSGSDGADGVATKVHGF